MTEKLYDQDSYLTEFDADVLSCEKYDEGYRIVLNKTAFFPTEGGQVCDSGTLDGIEVKDVILEGDVIYHHMGKELAEGSYIMMCLYMVYEVRH